MQYVQWVKSVTKLLRVLVDNLHDAEVESVAVQGLTQTVS